MVARDYEEVGIACEIKTNISKTCYKKFISIAIFN